MKYRNLFVVFFSLICIAACNSNTQQTTLKDTTNTATAEVPKTDFSQVTFATKKDTTCGMPLTAGLEDSVQLQGKVYGFCSKECKEEFVAKLKKENKR